MAHKDRRKFITDTGMVVIGTTCGCSLSGCEMVTGISDTPELASASYLVEGDKLKVSLDNVPELSKSGGSVKITNPEIPFPLIIVRTGERDFLAASLKCTHGGREIKYVNGENKFRCVSFGKSEFTSDGKNIKGPAKGPIKTYDASLGVLKKNILVVKLS